MRAFGSRRPSWSWVLLLAWLVPGGAEAQLRPVVSREIAVSEREASLRLGFQDGGGITVALSEGEVLLDGEVAGQVPPGGRLDDAWRSLLAEAIALEDGPLAQALVDWNPPAELTGAEAEVAGRIDRFMEEKLALPETGAEALPEPAAGQEAATLESLLRRADALPGLAEALEGRPLDQFQLRIGEDVEVGEGDTVQSTLIVVDGDLEVAGTVDGDAIVVGGRAILREGGRITGDLRVAQGRVERRGGEVLGQVAELDTLRSETVRVEDLDRLRAELREEVRREVLSSVASGRERSRSSSFSIVRNFGRAVAGLFEDIATFLVLAVLGVLAVHFGRRRMDVISLAARRAPGRSLVVGLAGGFLLLPVWLLGMVALAVSIIGIPVLLAWIPLFPLAAALAGLAGYLAVARNVGEWVADQQFRGLEWLRGANAYYGVVAGVAALMLPCAAASVSRILGIGFLTGMVAFVGSMVSFIALAVGFGAVLVTRGGRIRPYEAYEEWGDESWPGTPEPEPEPGFERPGTRREAKKSERSQAAEAKPSAEEKAEHLDAEQAGRPGGEETEPRAEEKTRAEAEEEDRGEGKDA